MKNIFRDNVPILSNIAKLILKSPEKKFAKYLVDKNKVSTFALAFGKGASGRGRQANVKRKILKKIDKNFVSSKIGCNFAELSAQEK